MRSLAALRTIEVTWVLILARCDASIPDPRQQRFSLTMDSWLRAQLRLRKNLRPTPQPAPLPEGLPEGEGLEFGRSEAVARVAKRHKEGSRGCDPEQSERARNRKHPRIRIRK